MKRNKMFFLAIGIPIVVLLSMTIKPLQATYLGETIKLQTAPVDPRDLFYGDYVNLDFEVERIDVSLLDKDLSQKFTRNGEHFDYEGKEQKLPVYLSLKNVDGIHKLHSVSEDKPSSGAYIKGVLLTNSAWDGNITIDIPIDRYYVQEDTGMKLEESARKGWIVADLKVYKGYPILKDVEVNYE